MSVAVHVLSGIGSGMLGSLGLSPVVVVVCGVPPSGSCAFQESSCVYSLDL